MFLDLTKQQLCLRGREIRSFLIKKHLHSLVMAREQDQIWDKPLGSSQNLPGSLNECWERELSPEVWSKMMKIPGGTWKATCKLLKI